MIEPDGDVLGDADLDESGSDDLADRRFLGDQRFPPGLEHHLGPEIRMSGDVLLECQRRGMDVLCIDARQCVGEIMPDHSVGSQPSDCGLPGTTGGDDGLAGLLLEFDCGESGESETPDQTCDGQTLHQEGEDHDPEGHDHDGLDCVLADDVGQCLVVLDDEREGEGDGASKPTPEHHVFVRHRHATTRTNQIGEEREPVHEEYPDDEAR